MTISKVRRILVSTTLASSAVVVSSEATGDQKPDAIVEGTVTCPSQGVAGEVETLLVVPRVLLMVSPVGMEVQVVVAVARG